MRKDYRLSWLIVLGFPAVVLCTAIFLGARISEPDRLSYFVAGWGALFLLDGLVTLTRFIRRNPMPKVPTA